MGSSDFLNSTQNLVHPEWEVVDPTPNIHLLFPRFDRKFFQGKLACVQLEWSKRMYSCAGKCYQITDRLGKSCIIRLSEPLLKLRSRKDLIETLLHEMIHAYCFVLGIREGGHGPNFKKIMNGINRVTGTNITVYHTFDDEVDLYKTHWWKCNGPCQHRGPHYGTVKRSSNRKPGPYDFWWAKHQQSCGGQFIKVKEPSPKRKKPTGSNKENDAGNGQQELNDSLANTSVIDELFSESGLLMEEFNRSNTRLKQEREEDELVSCVLCQKRVKRSEMTSHLERCYVEFLGDENFATFDPDVPSTSKAKPPASKTPEPSTSRKPNATPITQTTKRDSSPETSINSQREEHRKILLECGYSEEVLQMEKDIHESTREQSAEERMLNGGNEMDLTRAGEDCECPVCHRNIPLEDINRHLDGCFGA